MSRWRMRRGKSCLHDRGNMDLSHSLFRSGTSAKSRLIDSGQVQYRYLFLAAVAMLLFLPSEAL